MSGSAPAARYGQAVARIDEANAADPNHLELDGQVVPKELAHARMATEWVLRLDPEASELQLLAARAHHLRRWSVPRTEFDAGRAGYLRWRASLKKQHAAEVAAILAVCGYDDGEVERVQQLVRKEGLGRDPQVQTHEDALCLVFLQTQLEAIADQLGDDKTVDVVRKTIKKMSAPGIAAALELPMSPAEADIITRASAPA